METTLYDDNSGMSMKKMKLGMSLDLAASEQQRRKQARLNEMLATPDLGLFMLASPDLERFIIQQNGLVLTTPTPTTQILFPKSVTEEQEAYARGFVDALGELHKNYGTPLITPGEESNIVTSVASRSNLTVKTSTAVTGSAKTNTFPSTLTTTTLLPGSVFTSSTTTPQLPIVIRPVGSGKSNIMSIRFQPKVESAQTVPTFQTAVPVNVSPINMDDQELQKLDRKRARNRVAATRCRNRKLERISRLEERVKELKGQNSNLAETAACLREQVYKLKQDIIQHTQNGCQVMLTHTLL